MPAPFPAFAEEQETRAASRQARLSGRLLVGRWRLGRLLGEGGMSSVYAAVHRNGRELAIKVLNPDLAGNERARTRFLREGYIANHVGHQGVVSVLDEGVTDDGVTFLVMELLVGATLEQLRRRRGGVLPENEVLVVADHVLDVLTAAHGKGVVHRDIKPSNVFLTTDGVLKLLDFGVASLREVFDMERATRNGAVLGTPGFIAPEQARGRWHGSVGARCDDVPVAHRTARPPR
jgi:serine/threonine-protein kinase